MDEQRILRLSRRGLGLSVLLAVFLLSALEAEAFHFPSTFRNISGQVCVVKNVAQLKRVIYSSSRIFNNSSTLSVNVFCPILRSARGIADDSIDLDIFVNVYFSSADNGSVKCTWRQFSDNSIGNTQAFKTVFISPKDLESLPGVEFKRFPGTNFASLPTSQFRTWVIICKLPPKTGLNGFDVDGEPF
jgi:hypothetical protein